ncbi:MAG: COX15/CtaA family protein [Bacteroidota bacterium]
MESIQDQTRVERISSSNSNKVSYPNAIKVWLVVGLFMIFVQVVVGGITRLTGSGLSITKWEIVTGTLPPLNAAQWEEEFELYKATPQYEKINEGITLPYFKFIYFWEYIHRLWARLMGFVFIIPFAIFYFKGWFDRKLLRQLGVVIMMAATVASFGWIMVASGLINRPWVNAYKLTMHLSLAFMLYSYLLWTTLRVIQPYPQVINNKSVKKWVLFLTVTAAIQIVIGGIMSGMKAALFYPTWPDMNGEIIPAILFNLSEWNASNFINYDTGSFMAAFVQTTHRLIAYLLFFSGLAFFFTFARVTLNNHFKKGMMVFLSLLGIQVFLGIMTLLYSVGTIPVGLGVMHQAGALLLFSSLIYWCYLVSKKA